MKTILVLILSMLSSFTLASRNPFAHEAPQKHLVFIEATILEVDQSFDRELGVGVKLDSASVPGNALHMSLPIGPTPGSALTWVALLNQQNTLHLELAALQRKGHAEILASPKLLTVEGKPASIEAGEEIPYQSKTLSGDTSTSFKKAVLSLKVTPTVMPQRQIQMALQVSQDQVSDLHVNGVPAVRTKKINTLVRVKDGATVVLGGILERQASNGRERVPLLARLPILGQLVRHRHLHHERRELLIFVTPHIQ